MTRTQSSPAAPADSRGAPEAGRVDPATPFPLAADIPGRPFIHAHRIALNTRDPEMIEAIEARLREVRHIEIAEREPFLSKLGNFLRETDWVDWFCVVAAAFAIGTLIVPIAVAFMTEFGL